MPKIRVTGIEFGERVSMGTDDDRIIIIDDVPVVACLIEEP